VAGSFPTFRLEDVDEGFNTVWLEHVEVAGIAERVYWWCGVLSSIGGTLLG
jgi:hypothetical protein